MSASSTPTRNPFAFSAKRQIGGDGRLADPALARGDRDDGAHPGHRPTLRPAGGLRAGTGTAVRGGPPLWRRGAAARGALGGQHRGHRQHVGKRLDRLFGSFAQRLQNRAALGLDLDRKGDIAVADHDSRNHAE